MNRFFAALNSVRTKIGLALEALVAPVFTTEVELTGDTTEDSTLTVSNGVVTGNPAPTLSYAWSRGATPQANTTNSYLLTQADVGFTITATVTATNSQGSDTSSAVSAVVVAAPLISTYAGDEGIYAGSTTVYAGAQ